MSKIAKLAFPAPPPHRPYWHVDAKWVCGLLFALGLGLTLNLIMAWRLTAPEVAVPVATEVVASLFSPDGLDETASINELRQQAAAQPGEIVQVPVGSQSVTLTKQELATLSPREIRLKIFRQVVEPFYNLGVDGVAAQAGTPDEQAKFKQQAGLLGLLNRQTHDRIWTLVLWTGGVSLVFLIGLVGFSWHWGRLASPGVVILLTALPGALFAVALTTVGGGAAHVSQDLMRQVVGMLVLPYAVAAGAGLLLLLVAGVGRLAVRLR